MGFIVAPDREVRLVGVADVPRGGGPHRGPRSRRWRPTGSPDLPATVGAGTDPGSTWWAGRGAGGHAGGPRPGPRWANAATARWSSRLNAAGVDAYGVDPDRGRSSSRPSTAGWTCGPSRCSSHSEVVADEALGGIVLTGSIQWLRPNERDRLVDLVAIPVGRRRRPGPPLGHARSRGPATAHRSVRRPGPRPAPPRRDLGPPAGRPGFVGDRLVPGGDDRRLARVGADRSPMPAPSTPPSTPSTNCCSGRREYLVVATRER